MGTDYALLRREFRVFQNRKRSFPQNAKRMLITLGGADPQNMGSKVLEAFRLADLNGLDIVITAGASNPHFEELKSSLKIFTEALNCLGTFPICRKK